MLLFATTLKQMKLSDQLSFIGTTKEKNKDPMVSRSESDGHINVLSGFSSVYCTRPKQEQFPLFFLVNPSTQFYPYIAHIPSDQQSHPSRFQGLGDLSAKSQDRCRGPLQFASTNPLKSETKSETESGYMVNPLSPPNTITGWWFEPL